MMDTRGVAKTRACCRVDENGSIGGVWSICIGGVINAHMVLMRLVMATYHSVRKAFHGGFEYSTRSDNAALCVRLALSSIYTECTTLYTDFALADYPSLN